MNTVRFMEPSQLYELHKNIWIKTMIAIERRLMAADSSVIVKFVKDASNLETMNRIDISYNRDPCFSIQLVSKERLKQSSEKLFFGYVEWIFDKKFENVFQKFNVAYSGVTTFIPTIVNSFSRSFVGTVKYMHLGCRQIISGIQWDFEPHFETNDKVRTFLPTRHEFWDFYCDMPVIPDANQWMIKAEVNRIPTGTSAWEENPRYDTSLTSCVIIYKKKRSREKQNVLLLECKRDTEEELYNVYEFGENEKWKDIHPDLTWIRMRDVVETLLQSFINSREEVPSATDDLPWERTDLVSQWHTIDRLVTVMFDL